MDKRKSRLYRLQLQDTQRHFQTTSTVIYAVPRLQEYTTSEVVEQKENFQRLMICYFSVPLFRDTHWRDIEKNAKRM